MFPEASNRSLTFSAEVIAFAIDKSFWLEWIQNDNKWNILIDSTVFFDRLQGKMENNFVIGCDDKWFWSIIKKSINQILYCAYF